MRKNPRKPKIRDRKFRTDLVRHLVKGRWKNRFSQITHEIKVLLKRIFLRIKITRWKSSRTAKKDYYKIGFRPKNAD